MVHTFSTGVKDGRWSELVIVPISKTIFSVLFVPMNNNDPQQEVDGCSHAFVNREDLQKHICELDVDFAECLSIKLGDIQL